MIGRLIWGIMCELNERDYSLVADVYGPEEAEDSSCHAVGVRPVADVEYQEVCFCGVFRV